MKRYYEDAITVYPELSASRYLAVATLGEWHLESGRFKESAAFFPEAIKFMRSDRYVETTAGALLLATCGLVQVLAEDTIHGEMTLRQSVEMGLANHGNEHPYTRLANAYLGLALIALGRADEGQPLLNKHADVVLAESASMELFTLEGMEDRFRRQFCRHAAIVYERAGDAPQAEAWRKRESEIKVPSE